MITLSHSLIATAMHCDNVDILLQLDIAVKYVVLKYCYRMIFKP